MTALVGVVVPVMITVGTIIGSGLRQWSREAQSQVSRQVYSVLFLYYNQNHFHVL